jgi:ATP-dependent Clp protease protease subunit
MSKLAKESIDRFFEHNLHVETRTLYLGDDESEGINGNVASKVVKGLHLLGASPDKPITIYINSFGGCWFNGMAIYDAIKACPCEVTALVVGSAMSMGSIFLQAADNRVIYPNATIMVHDGYESRVDDTPKTFQNWAEYSKMSQRMMYEIYAERSGRPASFWRRKCAADLILSAKEAKELGLVDSIYGESNV